MAFTVGHYLAERLTQIGLKHHFAVAGDYNLILLDQLIEHGGTKQIYDCNELNCSFAAEGYARENGAAAAVVTFSVGAISAMNGLGGAYAENLPVILISGAPNSNDHGSGHVLHHTIGTTDYNYQMEMVKHVTCAAESITSADTAPAKIDHVIRTALREKKPAYLEIACNVASEPCVRPGPVSSLLSHLKADELSLQVALEESLELLGKAQNVVILVGSKLRACEALDETVALADKLGCAVTVMAAAKSFFSEAHPGFRGVYWGEVSSPGVEDVIKSADAIISLAPVWNDYSTVGWRDSVRGARVLEVDPNRVTVGGKTFEGFRLKEFVAALTKKVSSKPASLAKPYAPVTLPVADGAKPLTNDEMTRQINALVDGNTTLYAETGDSWFNATRMHLPEGAKVESEMQWGHIGWSVPSMFGNALAAPERQHVLMVGDGSFQLTAQEVAQMVRYELPVIIFLVNNYGYVIEIAIHDGPYNYIQNWDYAALMQVFNQGVPGLEGGKYGLGLHATTGAELADAIAQAKKNTRGPTLIECKLDQTDCTETLVQWGKFVAAANSRKPV
ncbi:alpha-keto acid decarboxylase family protein [Gluconobacter wancherniae]|uniref:alpha-keto acid decarboxylase family protein n=1 Tax=Gluconobacter wancherniae TaxID=1307955 RepID=UPI001B8D939F|nr:thiamine pyrophosphate-binding protein [Gluconobacter wancherniae]MBS1063838.1 alpha-keto acid decarboxylase family protein [Gluconobacter wancherniae]MBS1095630.1 alpha-keto acid decarboxylase family protein [Gluconobacter wancherniae]